MKSARILIVLALSVIFFIISLVTLGDYGANWDAFPHLVRGQAYYRLFAGGKTSSNSVQPYRGRQSYYEINPFDITWLTKTIGHPSATDIILAGVNQLMYKHWGILGDLPSYGLYGVVLTFIASVAVGMWSYQISGWIGGVISVISFYGLPVLFSEQHFNIKDPAIMAYNTIFLYLFWLGISKRRGIYLLFAALIGGISLGTKFNILFLGPVLAVWLVWYAKGNIIRWFRTEPLRLKITLFLVPVIMFAVFYATYPLLWSNFSSNMMSVVNFYRQVGGSKCQYAPMTGLWFIRCIDWQTIRLFIVTIPIPTLVLALIGGAAAITSVGQFLFAPFLWLFILVSIILRVILPINSLYGESLRQILEFIGPVSLLVGFGGAWLIRRYRHPMHIMIGVLLLYAPVFWHVVALHPNENLYTNVAADFFWKNEKQLFVNGVVSYGNAYKQGIAWINSNAENSARVSLVTGLGSAVPSLMFRSDIQYSPVYLSGYGQKGEYLIELTYPPGHATQFFPYKYVSTVLRPVYEKVVEGFPIVRIWKNDAEHLMPEFTRTVPIGIRKQTASANEVILGLASSARLQSMQIATEDPSCRSDIRNAYVLVSADGESYRRMYETVGEMNQSDSILMSYPFSGEQAMFIKLFTFVIGDCDWPHVQFTVIGFR